VAQLHCYLPEYEAELLLRRARRAGMSVSRYLAELARKDLVCDWPEDYFERLFDRDDIEPTERGPQREFEDRGALE
jgi:hypothetical protein